MQRILQGRRTDMRDADAAPALQYDDAVAVGAIARRRVEPGELGELAAALAVRQRQMETPDKPRLRVIDLGRQNGERTPQNERD
jgi:hypothetical protein